MLLFFLVFVANKIHSVKPVLGDWQSSYRRCDTDEVIICGVSNGHTHLYILKIEPPPQCEHYQRILTARHILAKNTKIWLNQGRNGYIL